MSQDVNYVLTQRKSRDIYKVMKNIDKIFSDREDDLKDKIQKIFENQEIPVRYLKPEASNEVLLELCASLLKYTTNPDVVWHAAHDTMRKTKASKQEVQALIRSMTQKSE